MSNYKTEPRGYWKVTKRDLENAKTFDGIEFPINATGKLWADGQGTITILKNSAEWNYLYKHIQKLDSFVSSGENTNSKSVPGKLRSCFKHKKP